MSIKAIGFNVALHSFSKENSYHIMGKVKVDGLGEIEMRDCLSTETIQAVLHEVEAVARLRLKGKLEAPQKLEGDAAA